MRNPSNLQNNMKRGENTCLKNRILLTLTEQSWKLISCIVVFVKGAENEDEQPLFQQRRGNQWKDWRGREC